MYICLIFSHHINVAKRRGRWLAERRERRRWNEIHRDFKGHPVRGPLIISLYIIV